MRPLAEQKPAGLLPLLMLFGTGHIGIIRMSNWRAACKAINTHSMPQEKYVRDIGPLIYFGADAILCVPFFSETSHQINGKLRLIGGIHYSASCTQERHSRQPLVLSRE